MSRQQFIYLAIRATLGRRPTRAEMYRKLKSGFTKYLKTGWLRYLAAEEELNETEWSWLDTPVEAFLIELETTPFQKAYKIPTILAFLTPDGVLPSVSLREIAQRFRDFYYDDPLHQTDFCDKSNQDWRSWENDKFANLALAYPVAELSRSRFFHWIEDKRLLEIDASLHSYLSGLLADQIRDIMEYRRIRYFSKRYYDYLVANSEPAVAQVAENPGLEAERQEIVYRKLIRDRIPEIIAAQGKQYEVRVLNDAEYLTELEWKLQEEVEEYIASGSGEELADLLEVILALATVHGLSQADLECLRLEKRAKRGGYERRLFLEKVVENGQ